MRLTKKQYKLLIFIRNTLIHRGVSPTFREMRQEMEVKYNENIRYALKALERKGYLNRSRGKIRGIVLLPKAKEMLMIQYGEELPEEKIFIQHNPVAGTSVLNTSLSPTKDVSIKRNLNLKGGEISGTQ